MLVTDRRRHSGWTRRRWTRWRSPRGGWKSERVALLLAGAWGWRRPRAFERGLPGSCWLAPLSTAGRRRGMLDAQPQQPPRGRAREQVLAQAARRTRLALIELAKGDRGGAATARAAVGGRAATCRPGGWPRS